MALAGSRLTGALVSSKSRKVTSLIVNVGTKPLRVPIADVTFEGKTLRLTVHPDALPEHRTDRDIAAEVWRLLRSDKVIMPDERKGLTVDVAGGIVTINGSVRRKSTKERAESLVAEVTGITELRSQLTDDLQLEIDIGARLYKSDIERVADIYPRSSLGDVVLFGRAPSPEVAADAVRVTSAVQGVGNVTNRLEVDSESSSGDRKSQSAAVD
jgi:osmotically-inducible protein OsmY